MFGFEFKGFNDVQKGYVALCIGILLLLHTLNIFREWFNGIFVIIALLLIVYGILKSHVGQALFAFIKKEKATKVNHKQHQ